MAVRKNDKFIKVEDFFFWSEYIFIVKSIFL